MATETRNVVGTDHREGSTLAVKAAIRERPAGKMISIWFFVGCLLTVYGVLILFAGLTSEGGREVAMAHLHAQIWWGAGLFIIGLVYAAVFRPKRNR
jgi:hypothetical protein